jgi:uncharacterized protein (DUF305 family)
MTRIRLTRRSVLMSAALLSAILLAAGCGAQGSFNDADVTFAQMMIPHHQQAVEMAGLADTRATDPQVKQLAVQIKAAQDPEIKTLTGWLRTWGKPTTMAGGQSMAMPGMMADGDMTKLKAASGKDFDRMFAQMMIAHHNGAIQMAADEQAGGKNADTKALAKNIATSQQAEVTTLQKIVDRL